MTGVIDSIERAQLRRVPAFQAGDRVRVHFQVVEGTRRRTQVFEGIVIKRQGTGVRETFTVRKQSFGVGVERTFPVHSPKIERIEVASRGDVRRAKLYYLREPRRPPRARPRAPLHRRRGGDRAEAGRGGRDAAGRRAAAREEELGEQVEAEEAGRPRRRGRGHRGRARRRRRGEPRRGGGRGQPEAEAEEPSRASRPRTSPASRTSQQPRTSPTPDEQAAWRAVSRTAQRGEE